MLGSPALERIVWGCEERYLTSPGVDRDPVGRVVDGTRVPAADGGDRFYAVKRFRLVVALDVVVKPVVQALLVVGCLDLRGVPAARVPVVDEHQRELGPRMQQQRPVVIPEHLVGREQVVGPAALQQHWRGLLRGPQVVGGAALHRAEDLPHGSAPVQGLTGAQDRGPCGRIEARVGAGGREVAGSRAEREQEAEQRLLEDPDGRKVVVRAGERVVERPAVWQQRVGEIAPGHRWGCGRDPHRDPVRASPWVQRAVPVHDAVPEDCSLERDDAAVGPPVQADPYRVHEPLVDQQSGQVLDVAQLVTGVVEPDPPVRAAGRIRDAGHGRAAGVVEAAGIDRQHGVAACWPRAPIE